MKIALDAMGGDHGVAVNVEAALLSLKTFADIKQIYLIGDQEEIKKETAKWDSSDRNKIEIVHSEQVVTMKDSPSSALRQKKNSSLAIMFDLQKNGLAHASVSAGNTGAVMAFALRKLGRLQGINRPGIAVALPTITDKPVIILDVGANAECKARNLLEFAYMGSVFAEQVFDMNHPKVGLLSIGEESSKGNDVTVLAHQLLLKSGVNFIGNAEGKDVHSGDFDVIVMDGFVGNIVLKHSESFYHLLKKMIKESIGKNFISLSGAVLMTPAFKKMKQKLNYENYGGAALLGINGNCVVAHGRSTPEALKNAIKEAVYLVNHNVNNRIEEKMISNHSEEEF